MLYAEPNYILRTQAIPNDARFGELYGFNNTGQGGGSPTPTSTPPRAGTSPVSARSRRRRREGRHRGHGHRRAHEDLSGKTVNCAATTPGADRHRRRPEPGREPGCADDNDHGTHVAGTIAAKANNGVGVAGVAFNAQLAICKALHGAAGTGSTAGVANCITYLAGKGAKVISMSLGGGASTTLQTAVSNAYKNGPTARCSSRPPATTATRP